MHYEKGEEIKEKNVFKKGGKTKDQGETEVKMVKKCKKGYIKAKKEYVRSKFGVS